MSDLVEQLRKPDEVYSRCSVSYLEAQGVIPKGSLSDFCMERTCAECYPKSWTITADRIEAEYMKYPLDKDGVPIKPDQTVFIGERKVIVEYICKDGFTDLARHFYPSTDCSHSPQKTTQKQLDTDAEKDMLDYWKCGTVNCERCPSTINGETPMERYGVASCKIAMTLDLMRRQREKDLG